MTKFTVQKTKKTDWHSGGKPAEVYYVQVGQAKAFFDDLNLTHIAQNATEKSPIRQNNSTQQKGPEGPITRSYQWRMLVRIELERIGIQVRISLALCPSDFAEKQQDNQNNQNEPYNPRWSVTPTSGMRP